MYSLQKLIEKNGFKNVKLLSEGGHGQCFYVTRGSSCYILKSYFSNSKSEAEHEENVLKELHGKTKGNPYFFKVETIPLSDEITCLCSQTVEGKTLADLMEKERPDFPEATRIMINACNSVKEIHEKGYIHFDIKPSNLYQVDKVKNVITIDFGSAVKIGEKPYDEIINSKGYWSTKGFLTKKLSDFCSDIETYRIINPSQGEKDKLIQSEKSLSVKEDIFALICTYWYLITGDDNFGVWGKDMRYLSYEKKIYETLSKNNIPKYLLSKLTELFLQLIPALNNPEESVKFSSVSELREVLIEVLEIFENKGFHPEILLRGSQEHYEKYLSKQLKEFNPDLLADIEEMTKCD